MSPYSTPAPRLDQNPTRTLEEQIGTELLGPVIHRWLLGLHQYAEYYNDGETKFLYCARAGVRIKNLYDIFLQRFSRRPDIDDDVFWISRIAIAKGVFNRQRDRSVEIISREYHHAPIRELVRGLLRHHPNRLAGLNLNTADLDAHGHNFPGWLTVKGPVQNTVHEYLKECSNAFDTYLTNTLGKNKRAVLIDSGWQGSAQSLLNHAHQKIEWRGLYFGRILTENHDPSIASQVIGLLFENEHYQPGVPESAFVEHRHIIECLLEPNGYSIEEILAPPFESDATRLIESNLNETPDSREDRFYIQVSKYLKDNVNLPIHEIIKRHQQAMPELARIIIQPSRAEAKALYSKARSADFGKKLLVPVLLDAEDNDPSDSDQRIHQALWPQGQVALEYEGGVANDLQMRLSGLADHAAYFDPHGQTSEKAESDGDSTADIKPPTVAIITRTKNRPLLLKRAAESVGRQTFDDYVWVIVNDGGDDVPVRKIIEASSIDRQRIILVSNSKSLGMEAASNAGINASDSKYIVIHDDDDSWHADFLADTVEYLESARGNRYGGVITQSLYVSEEIRGDKVIEHGRWPYQDWVRNVQLAEMACGNFFPPIAFVYKRSIYDKVGGYNEMLPVLGDWFYNMEFLLEADIGVITKPYAYYHHRDRGDSRSGLYANSVIGGVSKHEEFAAVARNEFLRRHSNTNNAALSVILGHVVGDMRSRFDRIPGHVKEVIPKSSHVNPVPSTPSTPSTSTIIDYDVTDRYWAASEINRIRAQTRAKWFGTNKTESLSVDPSWPEIVGALRKLNRAISTPPNFDEERYLHENQDVYDAVSSGKIRSAYLHYIIYGRDEGRKRPEC